MWIFCYYSSHDMNAMLLENTRPNYMLIGLAWHEYYVAVDHTTWIFCCYSSHDVSILLPELSRAEYSGVIIHTTWIFCCFSSHMNILLLWRIYEYILDKGSLHLSICISICILFFLWVVKQHGGVYVVPLFGSLPSQCLRELDILLP